MPNMAQERKFDKKGTDGRKAAKKYDYCANCANAGSRKFYVHPCPSCIHGNTDWFQLTEGCKPPVTMADEVKRLHTAIAVLRLGWGALFHDLKTASTCETCIWRKQAANDHVAYTSPNCFEHCNDEHAPNKPCWEWRGFDNLVDDMAESIRQEKEKGEDG